MLADVVLTNSTRTLVIRLVGVVGREFPTPQNQH
jgi:hypothetical protein